MTEQRILHRLDASCTEQSHQRNSIARIVFVSDWEWSSKNIGTTIASQPNTTVIPIVKRTRSSLHAISSQTLYGQWESKGTNLHL